MKSIAAVLTLIVVLTPVACQRHVGQVTLQMDWHRGDPHYGPNFIWLSAPCQSASAENCQCRTSFLGSANFVDYVSSFQDRKIPVTYDLYDVQGHAGAKLVNVGNWRADQFHNNDGLLATEITSVPSVFGKPQIVHLESPGDCFPMSLKKAVGAKQRWVTLKPQ